MIRENAKKFLAGGLGLAMIISTLGIGGGVQSVSAAKKKATVKLSSTKVTLKVGKTKTLKIKKTQVKKIKSTKWSTNKKKIATVSKKGKITAKKAGSAKITAKVKYIPKGQKKAKTKKLTCKVTVKANTPTPSATPSGPSNVGAPHEITLSNGDKITVKDNGTVRKDVTALNLADNEMKTGINLGNTLEATVELDYKRSADFQNNTDRTKYDIAWSNPVTTRAYIELLHSYGLNTLRIPVAWSNGDKDDGTYTIDPALLDRVEEVANWALDLGMYVVINDHWDNLWWAQFGACKYEYSEDADGNEVRTKVADEEMRAAAWVRYERYWTQIAERFKGYSDHLIFEGANEELGDGFNKAIVITDDYKGYEKPKKAGDETLTCGGNLTEAQCYELTNQINQKFVDLIRASGGNNASRFLLIPGYSTDIYSSNDDRYQMPKDTAENGKDKLFISVHFYVPTEYALDEGSGDYTEEDRETVKELLAGMKKFSDAGYATILGECAVCSPSNVEGNVITWYTDVFTEAAKYHAVPLIWENGAYFDREKPCIYYKDVAEFLNKWNGATGTLEGVTRITGGAVSDTTVPRELAEYIDAELWNEVAIHSYLFFQTNDWSYRNLYKPLKKLSAKEHSWDAIGKGASEKTTVTDVNLTEDGVEYTVAFDNASLEGNKYTMLGITTNIDCKEAYKGLNLKATALSVKIDGEEQLAEGEEKNMPPKTDKGYYCFMIANTYDKVFKPSDFPLGELNESGDLKMADKSIEITFRIEGIQPVLDDIASGEFVDPETGLKISEMKAK